ncbi:MAG: beta-galactosidase trimerization domain-containing protein [Treponema sp.]|nr:beta-galactosidase trimerization domain-containing protein [Treponema sp.]
MDDLRYRQIHLDFHTSELIEGIGSKFSRDQFQEMLKLGHVDSIVLYSKCHHGWAYHPSKANQMHPHLDFDLLGAQIEAAHEINVKTPVYLSVGFDEKLTRMHPEWLRRNKDESIPHHRGKDFFSPIYHELCLNSPYLEIIIAQIEEVLRLYDADGLWLDIAGEKFCYCQNCIRSLIAEGIDPRDDEAVRLYGRKIFANYADKVDKIIEKIRPGLPVYHNNGHIACGRRDGIASDTHLDLETIATGYFGYDGFPMSASYVRTLGKQYAGITGKFHFVWGDNGGYKHPNTLRYETARHLVYGARCSVGDQLHPYADLDRATYTLIGSAYAEIERKEAWCRDAVHLADAAILSADAIYNCGELPKKLKDKYTAKADIGAFKIMTEGKYLFDMIDQWADFSPYKLIVMPDYVTVNSQLEKKLHDFLAGGGKLLASGYSGQTPDSGYALDFGAEILGDNEYTPDYIHPLFELPCFEDAAFVMYLQGQKIKLTDGKELAYRENPFFNRDAFHFSAHFHTVSSRLKAGPGMVQGKDGIYIAWKIFSEYAEKGSMISKLVVLHALDLLLGDQKTLRTSLPVQGTVALTYQKKENRYVNHVLYGAPVKRGDIGVIEDSLPIYNIKMRILIDKPAKSVKLVPQNIPLEFTCNLKDSKYEIEYVIPEFECHQMTEITAAG